MIRLFLYNRYKKCSDQELITLYIQEQCVYTLPILYDRYGHLVMGVCLKYLKSTEDSEDITMELFAELPELILKYEITYFKSWLYQVTRHRCLKQIRKNDPIYKGVDIDSQLKEEVVEDNYELEIQLSLMEEVLQQLPSEQKRCIELFYLDLKSYQEIGNELNISINQVKSAIQNGKRRLKIRMGEHNEKI